VDEFRQEIRSWLADNCPESMRTPMDVEEMPAGGRQGTYPNPDTKVWLERMAERGFTAPTWPKAYGGAGLSREQVEVLQEEMQLINARPALVGMGLSMIGPALLEFGNEAQKTEHLPKIARGEIRWCQGYSEPGSGSDLASLRTSAVSDGDDYIINGQKIWTSGADTADWIFCLVRTDPDAPKHQGITFILFDMESPGVTPRPIRLISGRSPFCETFFDNVRVPKANVVSEVNEGWTVAKRLLQYERTAIGGIGGSTQQTATISDLAKEYVGLADGKLADPIMREEVITQRINDRSLRLALQQLREETEAGRAPGPQSSMFKYYATEQNKSRYDLMMSMMGTRALAWEAPEVDPDFFDEEELETTRAWLRSRANSIEGGSSEIQLNIIAKRVLGLPD
tara:strand:- start:11718 stop:12908 length:1191 start_codon:yes stop_codon:yes gene_type:complete